jgi:hypothetical protein
MAIVMPIMGSIALILLFYFLNIMYYLLVVLLALNGFFSIVFVFYPLIRQFLECNCENYSRVHLTIFTSCCTRISLSLVISLVIGALFVILWLTTNNWIVIDVLCFSIGIMALSVLRLPNMKVAALLLGLFFVYDVFWVFFSEFFFKQNVMVTVATSVLDLPVLLKFPKLLHEWSPFNDIVVPYPLLELIRRYRNLSKFGNMISWFILGMGDVILPGMFLNYLYRFDLQRSLTSSPNKGYFGIGMTCYSLGMVWTQVMLLLLRRGQPALLYLVPSVMLPVICFAIRRKELRLLWAGPPSNESTQNEPNDNLENISLVEDNNTNVQEDSLILSASATAAKEKETNETIDLDKTS